MTIVGVAALIICPFVPEWVYDFRRWQNLLIKSMYRSDEFVKEDFYPCLQSFTNLKEMHRFYQSQEPNTLYPAEQTATERALTNFAVRHIIYLRNNYTIFHHLFRKHGPTEPFISDGLQDSKGIAWKVSEGAIGCGHLQPLPAF